VFALLFEAFAVPAASQHRVLFAAHTGRTLRARPGIWRCTAGSRDADRCGTNRGMTRIRPKTAQVSGHVGEGLVCPAH
jgi:hypothetical protein